MPRKLGPRHARSRRKLATVNRLASAANDIHRLAWHDHQTRDGEGAAASAFASATAADRQAAKSLATLWFFTRYLAMDYQIDDAFAARAQRALDTIYRLDTQGHGLLLSGREYLAAKTAIDERDEHPTAEVARALSHLLARIARRRCNWNSNVAYQPRVDARGVVWSEGALWGPQFKGATSVRKATAEKLLAAAAVKAASPVPAEPVLELLPGGGQPAAPASTEAEEDAEEISSLFGLRRLRKSIFAR